MSRNGLGLVGWCKSSSSAGAMDYGAELAACCTTISDAMVDSRCVEVSQAGNEAACEAERSNLEDGGTC